MRWHCSCKEFVQCNCDIVKEKPHCYNCGKPSKVLSKKHRVFPEFDIKNITYEKSNLYRSMLYAKDGTIYWLNKNTIAQVRKVEGDGQTT